MRKFLLPNEYIEIKEDGNERKFYIVDEVEDLIYDYRGYGTVATVTLGSFTQVTDLEPKEVTAPEMRLYQCFLGIDVGHLYMEILAGKARRGVFKVPKPTSSTYYVGYNTKITSPFLDPKAEFFLRYAEVPAIAVYNPLGFTVTPYISARGKKYKLYDLESEKIGNYVNLPNVTEILEGLKRNKIPHRRVVLRGFRE